MIVASVPTLGRRDERSGACERLKRFDPSQFKCIIIDEAHHSAAPSYRRILDHFGAFHQESHLLVWGCSATLRRNDHLALGDLFQKVVYHVGMDHMIKNGWLCQPELLQVFTEFDIDSVAFNSADGDDFSLDQLSLTLNTPKRNDLIASTWLSEAKISITSQYIFFLSSSSSLTLYLLISISRTKSQLNNSLRHKCGTCLRPGGIIQKGHRNCA